MNDKLFKKLFKHLIVYVIVGICMGECIVFFPFGSLFFTTIGIVIIALAVFGCVVNTRCIKEIIKNIEW